MQSEEASLAYGTPRLDGSGERIAGPAAELQVRYRVGEAIAHSRQTAGEAANTPGEERVDLQALRRALGQPKPTVPVGPGGDESDPVVAPPSDAASSDEAASSTPPSAAEDAAVTLSREAVAGAAPAVLYRNVGRALRRAGFGGMTVLVASIWPWDMHLLGDGPGLPPLMTYGRAPPPDTAAPLPQIMPGAMAEVSSWSPLPAPGDLRSQPRIETPPGPVQAPRPILALLASAEPFVPASGQVQPAATDAERSPSGYITELPDLFVSDRDGPPAVTEVAVRLPQTDLTSENEVSRPALSPTAAARTSTRVVIHYRRAREAGVRNNLTASLHAAGFERVEWRHVRATVRQTQTRFFHDTDRALSDQAVAVLSRIVQPAAGRDFTHYSPPARSGTIEIWLED